MLTNFVFCELTSQIGFMRYRAVWVYNSLHYSECKSFSFDALVLKALNELLFDSELPVRYEALLALGMLLRRGTPKGALDLELRIILGIYIDLLNEFSSGRYELRPRINNLCIWQRNYSVHRGIDTEPI